ncbi:MAG TPA: hypothetical protein VF680_16865 [Allosphingosinicella sp.]|jgi:hypothetical protein
MEHELKLEELYKLNKYQTPLTEELRESLPKEVWTDLLDFISSVEFIKRLIAPEEIRGYAKDKPKSTDYNDGRIEVDLTNPHILEDMDFFRERALYFQKHGKYTPLTPNPNPKSAYAQFWRDELHKWKYGLIRPSDGEWIPGELYFYWNYSPIWLVEDTDTKSDGTKSQGERIQAFGNPWLGDYLFHHYVEQAKRRGKHGKMLKTRGIGASFKAASWSPRNMHVFKGSGNPNFHLASDKGFLSGDKGIWGKVVDTLDWIAEHTPLPRMRTVDRAGSTLEIQLGYKDEYGSRKGLLSSVHGISLKDNPDKARGIRGPLIHYEEDGLFPNLEKAWNVNRKAVEDGNTTFGFMIAMGTGGVEGGSFEGSEKLFYSPGGYNIYGLPNIFDKNATGEHLCGFFWGAYMNRKNCYDEKIGEPDIIKALIEILTDRYLVKYSSTDPSAITQKKAEEPITPQEAIMRTEGTVFPVSDLKEHLENIMVKRESFLAEHYVGELVRTPKGVEWKPNADKHPLRSYDKDSANREGCLEIFEMPSKNANGEIAQGRYIFGIDPIDADAGTSLFSIIGLDTFTDRIVCEYTGRPRLAEEAYEISLRILEFYNGEANYESNLKGLFSYFDKKNALYRLCDVPQVLKDMDYVKATNLYGNKAKGTNANVQVNKWGRKLHADWMNSPIVSSNEEDAGKINLHTMRGLAHIEEAIKWNSDGNFDRISAAGMLFIFREDRYKRIQSAITNQHKKVESLANDNFFNKNYKSSAQKAIGDKPVI